MFKVATALCYGLNTGKKKKDGEFVREFGDLKVTYKSLPPTPYQSPARVINGIKMI